MPTPARPTFGKRNVPKPATRPDIAATVVQLYPTVPHGSDDEEQPAPGAARVVPRSFRAAMLSGLVIGFCFAGLDLTQAGLSGTALAPLLDQAGLAGTAAKARPVMIALSLLGGARAAATTLLVAHSLLARTARTGYSAYIVGGAIVALAYDLLFLAVGYPPQHGWLIDGAAGAGAGFFYRMFAGAQRDVRRSAAD